MNRTGPLDKNTIPQKETLPQSIEKTICSSDRLTKTKAKLIVVSREPNRTYHLVLRSIPWL